MDAITANEMKVVLTLFKDMAPYNANSLSRHVMMTAMGTRKVLKKLELKGILRSRRLGKAFFYNIDSDNAFAKEYVTFLLQKEAVEALPRVKRWVGDLATLHSCARVGIIFGSVLEHDRYNDVDVLLVLEQDRVAEADALLKQIQQVTAKRIHVLKQTMGDFERNMRSNAVVQSAVKGLCIFGFEELYEVMRRVAQRAED